eukprot:GHVS01035441.1.p1 GENE.GHVS01035441.1~~GHVS01035441.1.p1  ORF type:complete len:360 (+),score=78.61 GHVS01035441.1:98-1081(+)
MGGPVSSDPLSELLDRSHSYLKLAGLRPFLLSLPLSGQAADGNQKGIREKMLKNRSHVQTPYNPPDADTHTNADAVEEVDNLVEKLVEPEIVGFVLVIAEYVGPGSATAADDNGELNAAYQYRPVAGGIVHLLDETERAVRAIWCRRSLPLDVSEVLLKVVTLRLFAHAFEWQYPDLSSGGGGGGIGGGRAKRVAHKLVSALETHSLAFPRQSYRFITGGMMLSKHWEMHGDGGAHNDAPTQKCKCFKLSDDEASWQFWGISESRFVKYWNVNKNLLIPINPPEIVIQQFHRNVQLKRSAEPSDLGSEEKKRYSPSALSSASTASTA